MSNKFLRQVFIEKKCWLKMMIAATTYSMLGSPSTSDNDEMNIGAYKSTLFGNTIKHWMK